MNRIYVIGRAPSIGADGESEASTGGFGWYETWQEAAAAMIGLISERLTIEGFSVEADIVPEHDGFDYRFVAIDVPASVWGEGEERVTAWLDDNRELWEPPRSGGKASPR